MLILKNPGKNFSYPGKKYPRPGPTRNKIPRPDPTRPENILKNMPRPRTGFGPQVFIRRYSQFTTGTIGYDGTDWRDEYEDDLIWPRRT